MNADFHYYATFIAARYAGYPEDEALTIAHASQYVDISDKTYVEKDLLDLVLDFEPTPTTESFEQLARKNTFTKRSGLVETSAIWTSFHFLPGNFRSRGGLSYDGPVKWGLRRINSKEMQDVELVCRPNSALAIDMVNDLKSHKGKPYYLHLLGIRMHVLADTWAHEGFCGTCNWWINNLATEPTWVKSNEPIGLTAKAINKLAKAKPFLTTPEGVAFNSYAYLGHGRIGHVPDLPYACFTYQPNWSVVEFERNNPVAYMRAFRQMVAALEYLRLHKQTDNVNPFKARTYWAEPEKLQGQLEEIENIFKNKSNYSGEHGERVWEGLAGRNFASTCVFPLFNPTVWKENAKPAGEEGCKNTNYYLFNKAASIHLAYVQQWINNERHPN